MFTTMKAWPNMSTPSAMIKNRTMVIPSSTSSWPPWFNLCFIASRLSRAAEARLPTSECSLNGSFGYEGHRLDRIPASSLALKFYSSGPDLCKGTLQARYDDQVDI